MLGRIMGGFSKLNNIPAVSEDDLKDVAAILTKAGSVPVKGTEASELCQAVAKFVRVFARKAQDTIPDAGPFDNQLHLAARNEMRFTLVAVESVANKLRDTAVPAYNGLLLAYENLVRAMLDKAFRKGQGTVTYKCGLVAVALAEAAAQGVEVHALAQLEKESAHWGNLNSTELPSSWQQQQSGSLEQDDISRDPAALLVVALSNTFSGAGSSFAYVVSSLFHDALSADQGTQWLQVTAKQTVLALSVKPPPNCAPHDWLLLLLKATR